MPAGLLLDNLFVPAIRAMDQLDNATTPPCGFRARHPQE
jgi:hypothetical protein